MVSLLIIAGAVLQGVGLALVFVEIGFISAHDLGSDPWWVRLRRWFRSKLRRRRGVTVGVDIAAGALGFGGSATAKVRPGPLAEDASVADRLTRLERFVNYLDEDVDQMREQIDRDRAASIARADQGDAAIRDALRESEDRRRAALRSSLRRQGFGAAFIAAGLIIGTVGAIS